MKKIRAKKIKVSTGARVARSMGSITKPRFDYGKNLGKHLYPRKGKPR
jgi:hypothetical protein